MSELKDEKTNTKLKYELMLNKKMSWMPCYLKSEADKVIAELKKACNDKDDWCLHTLKENRHHKYKRCLAMAKWCHDKWTMSLGWDPADGYTADFFLHYKKWEKRWLELAEKFKEAT